MLNRRDMEKVHVFGWYIVYTKPLWEKKVSELFYRKKIEHYFPMKKIKREETGGIRITYEPLFASHVFVHATPAGLSRIKMINGVISLVHWQENLIIIQNEEIDAVRKILNLSDNVILEKIPVNINASISISENAGIQSEIMNDMIIVRLPSLGYALKAKINRRLITTMPVSQPDISYQPHQPIVPKFAI